MDRAQVAANNTSYCADFCTGTWVPSMLAPQRKLKLLSSDDYEKFRSLDLISSPHPPLPLSSTSTRDLVTVKSVATFFVGAGF